jgi:hypothetical protein
MEKIESEISLLNKTLEGSNLDNINRKKNPVSSNPILDDPENKELT